MVEDDQSFATDAALASFVDTSRSTGGDANPDSFLELLVKCYYQNLLDPLHHKREVCSMLITLVTMKLNLPENAEARESISRTNIIECLVITMATPELHHEVFEYAAGLMGDLISGSYTKNIKECYKCGALPVLVDNLSSGYGEQCARVLKLLRIDDDSPQQNAESHLDVSLVSTILIAMKARSDLHEWGCSRLHYVLAGWEKHCPGKDAGEAFLENGAIDSILNAIIGRIPNATETSGTGTSFNFDQAPTPAPSYTGVGQASAPAPADTGLGQASVQRLPQVVPYATYPPIPAPAYNGGFTFGNTPVPAPSSAGGFTFGNKPVPAPSSSAGGLPCFAIFGKTPVPAPSSRAGGFTFCDTPVQAPPYNGGFMFGNTPVPAASSSAGGFIFGSAPAPAPSISAGGFTFGSVPAPGASSSTGCFTFGGAPAPAPSSSTGGFTFGSVPAPATAATIRAGSVGTAATIREACKCILILVRKSPGICSNLLEKGAVTFLGAALETLQKQWPEDTADVHGLCRQALLAVLGSPM